MVRSLFFLAIISVLGGCITTGEYLALKNDVNELKREYYSHDKDLALMKKSSSEKRTGMDSFEAIRDSQEQINSQLSSFASELQQLQARVDESTHLMDKALKDRAEELEIIQARLNEVEKNMEEMRASLAGIKSSESPKKEEVGEKVEEEAHADDPRSLYEESHRYFKRGDYKKARKQFRYILDKYPDNDLADNCQFWIAETYYRENDSENAIIEYQKLIKNYPDSPKIPTALFKQGMSFKAIGDRDAAKAVFQLIVQKYPKSPEAKRVEAELGPTSRTNR